MLNSIFTESHTLASLLVCLGVSIALGVLNSLVFLWKSKHSAGFALTLALLPMAVAVVIILVNGNLGAGVAVAGAFTLVRFRSVPGTAREIAAIFTSMAIGLALGMGCVGIAVIFFVLIAAFTMILTAIDFGAPSKHEKSLKITIPESFDYTGLFDEVFEKFGVKVTLQKIRTTNMGTLFELTYGAVFPSESIPKEFIDEIRTRNGNLNIVVSDFTDKEVL